MSRSPSTHARRSDRAMLAGVAISAAVHAGAAWGSLRLAEHWQPGADAPALSARLLMEPEGEPLPLPPPEPTPTPPEAQPEPPPPPPPPTIALGNENSEADTPTETWIGGDKPDPRPFAGPKGSVDQAALTMASGPGQTASPPAPDLATLLASPGAPTPPPGRPAAPTAEPADTPPAQSAPGDAAEEERRATAGVGRPAQSPPPAPPTPEQVPPAPTPEQIPPAPTPETPPAPNPAQQQQQQQPSVAPPPATEPPVRPLIPDGAVAPPTPPRPEPAPEPQPPEPQPPEPPAERPPPAEPSEPPTERQTPRDRPMSPPPPEPAPEPEPEPEPTPETEPAEDEIPPSERPISEDESSGTAREPTDADRDTSASPGAEQTTEQAADADEGAAESPDEPLPPAAPATPESAASAAQAPGGPAPDYTPGELSDREALAVAIREAVRVEPGKPMAAKGLEIRTVRPRWSLYTQSVAAPRDAIVRVRFGRDGTVVRAEMVRSSGWIDVDRPLLNAIYNWTASGKPLRDLPPAEEGQEPPSVAIVFQIVLRR